MLRSMLFASAALCGLGLSQAALAQGSAPASAGPTVEEVIVTAERRAENLQQVPLSVTALTAKDLSANGITTTTDLTQMVPGLLYGRSTNFNQPSIRGIGTRNAASGDEPNVATYIDGVYQPNSIGTPFELTNIERIEVLKGPQGTLYGRNATGGAIIITTKAPSFTPTGSVQATYGRFDYFKVAGSISGPIIPDKLAASLAAVRYRDGGYVHNIYLNSTDGRSQGTAVRAKLLATPTDTLKLQLNGFYSSSFNNVLTSSYALNGNSTVRTLNTRAVLNPTGLPLSTLIADKPYTTASGFDPRSRTRQWFVDAHFDWDLGFATLSGLASNGRTRTRNESNTEASPFVLSRTQYTSTNHERNEELVLTSPSDQRITWIVGGMGFQAKDVFPLISTSRSTTTGAFTPSNILYGQNTKAWAGFGEVTWEAVDHLFLTGGLRYSWDKKTGFNKTNAAALVQATSRFHNTSPRFVARYEFNPDTNVYASYSQGYKSGGFNATSAAGVIVASTGASAAVKPEKVKAYEAGLKTTINGNIRFNAAAFHYDYTDLQVSALVLDPVTRASLTNLQNAGKAKVDGVEASVLAQLTEHFSLNGTVSVMKGKIHDFTNAVLPLPLTNLANCTPGGTPTLTGNVSCNGVNVSGNDLIRAPRYTFTIGGAYTTEMAGGKLTLSANAFFSDKYYADLGNTVVQPKYEIVNASATWRAPDEHTYVTVFGNNLTNQVYAVGHLISAFATETQAAKPRWWGVTVGYDF